VKDTTLYVSNLPVSATEKELMLKFGSCGSVVTATIMLDASTGRSKRFAFVEMANRADALAAIRRLNLTTYDGRLMSVNLARPADASNADKAARAPVTSVGRGH
jgi:RNA recognition motif-containing protein